MQCFRFLFFGLFYDDMRSFLVFFFSVDVGGGFFFHVADFRGEVEVVVAVIFTLFLMFLFFD